MEGGTNTELLTAAIVAGAFVALILLLVYAIRRARRARQREIEAAGEDRPAPAPKHQRAALRAEDIVPEEAAHELPEAPTKEEPQAPPRARPPAREKAAEPSVSARDLPAAAQAPEPARREPVAVQAPRGKTDTLPSPKPVSRPVLPVRAEIAQTVEKPRPPEAPPRPKRRDTAALAPGLARTRAGWVSRLGELFVAKREIDPALVDEIEKVLLTADIGVRTSQKLLEEIRSSLGRRELADPQAVWNFLRGRCIDFLRVEAPAVEYSKAKPFVLLAIGVNGSGKTTTIGKLASKLKANGQTVLLAAGDTFRAAATEQLEVWGSRVSAPVVRGKEGGDPSSVIFEAIKRAANEGIDVVIADTAGRLHTKTNLMDELQKIRRVAGKASEGAPHETWLVIDATSGQNAIAQAQIFTQAMSVTGIVLTKLDGTARGGVILGIADQLGIPVRYIGVGERVEDLREFDAEEFVEALFENVHGC
jgi:fused signal recognition particle receptor